MKPIQFIPALAWATLVAAQSAPDFPLMVEENLAVTYTDTDTVVSPGVLLPRTDVLEAPTAYPPPGGSPNTIYVLLMIDQDVPRNDTKVNLLHWLQPNLVARSGALSFVEVVDGGSTAVGAEYIPPTPPGGSGPHAYTFLLFAQPSQWTIPASYSTINPPADTSARIGFDVVDFISQSGLGDPLTANYLRVLNGTGAETTSAASMTYAAVTSMMASDATSEATASISMGSEATASTSMASMSMASSGAGSETTEAGPATSAVASAATAPAADAAADGATAIRGSTNELLIGLAMGVAGAGLWML